MDAWTTAMSTVEKLLEGVSQSINDGAVILALTSWHIFPDIVVVGAGPEIIRQDDSLYPKGTVITLGQSSRPPDATADGVFSSLPLAFLKYYGDPVIRTRILGESTSRLTFSEVMQVVLGSMLAGWGTYARDVVQCCVNIVSLADFMSSSRHYQPSQPRSWIHLLGESAKSFLTESGSTQPHIRGLTMRGLRRYKTLLWNPENEHPPLFGLTRIGTVLRLIENMEHKISLLRLVAHELRNANHRNVVIRYRAKKSEPEAATDETTFELGNIRKSQTEPAADGTGLELSNAHELHNAFGISNPREFYSAYGISSAYEHLEGGENLEEDMDIKPDPLSKWTWEYATAIGKDQNRKMKKRKQEDLSGHTRWTSQENHHDQSGEDYIQNTMPAKEITPRSFHWNMNHHLGPGDRHTQTQAEWICVLGDPNDAAIFKLSHMELSGSEELQYEHIDEALRRGWMNRNKLIQLMDLRGEFAHPKPPQYLSCLRALAAAAEAYKLMPGATISTELFSAPLSDALWIPSNKKERLTKALQVSEVKQADAMNSLIYGSSVDPRLLSKTVTQERPESPIQDDLQELRSYSLSRSQIFSCIAMFENRRVNLDPSILDQVMALSAGGSIYVAMPLICDPYDAVEPNEVKHIIGNINKPGLSLMIPPMVPKLRKVDEDKWTLVNHAAFDGRLDNSFWLTSLHLSFTGYQLPMMMAEHGYQGVEANFVETLVSVFDGKEWVADLDVLKALAMPSVSRIGLPIGGCRHKKGNSIPEFPLTSIDSWDEFIDRPSNACIFRASGNWLARLSAVVINTQQSLDTVVLEDKKRVCWKCVAHSARIEVNDAQKSLLFIA